VGQARSSERAWTATDAATRPRSGQARHRPFIYLHGREGIDTSNATGRMVAGVLASLAELELELGRERRAAAREARRARCQSIGRPKKLDESKSALAHRMHANGESASTIAATLGVSRAIIYQVLAGEQ
jgi:DNA invertase Pin-like site-specific DNA recombinase